MASIEVTVTYSVGLRYLIIAKVWVWILLKTPPPLVHYYSSVYCPPTDLLFLSGLFSSVLTPMAVCIQTHGAWHPAFYTPSAHFSPAAHLTCVRLINLRS